MPDSNQPGEVSTKTIAVIGLGYVGLPLAVAFAKHHKVIGFDTSLIRITELRERIDSTGQVGYSELRDARMNLDLHHSDGLLSQCNVFIVTVPTPVDAHNVPDLSHLQSACETVGRNLTRGAIVVFESTVYPGCTEDFCVPILERVSGRKLNKDFFVGYSPERVNPGDNEHTLRNVTKIVSGSSKKAIDEIEILYRSVVSNVYQAPSIKVAEAAKAIENAQRDINIAFVNELAMMFSKMGIDTGEVLKAAGTKWNFLQFKPGLVGGHCIGVDPYYLAHAAAKVGYHTEMILAGRRTNESVAPFIAQRLVKEMKQRGCDRTTPIVLVLGTTFKEDCPDGRNSKVIDLIRELQEYGCGTVTYEPTQYRGGTIPQDMPFDGIVVAVAHQEFKKPTFQWARLKHEKTVLFDVKGIVPDEFVDLRL